MRLAHGLMIRFVVIALVCLGAASTWVLIDIDRSLRAEARSGATFVVRQMELQLSLRGAVIAGASPFPISKPVMDDGLASGICMRYRPIGGEVGQILCKGGGNGEAVPGWFEALYRLVFDPSRMTSLPVAFRGEVAGFVEIVADPTVTITTAWSRLRTVADVTAVTVVAATILVMLAIGEALRPSRAVLAGLERMAGGDLETRLPAFRILEFRTIAAAFNGLAERLQKGEAERGALTRKLFQLQEDERRHLARELHDEFGQNLVAICALAASIEGLRRDDAETNDARVIGRIVGDMIGSLRGTLEQLRPPELDELGLTVSLQGLIGRWGGSAGDTSFTLQIQGEIDDLSPAVAISVFRIVQEGLTNAARHAKATEVRARLTRYVSGNGQGDEIEIKIEDNGGPSSAEPPSEPGLGMLGMKERVAALGGHLTAGQIVQGFRLTAVLPARLAEPEGGAAA